jgi:hypothetical protein
MTRRWPPFRSKCVEANKNCACKLGNFVLFTYCQHSWYTEYQNRVCKFTSDISLAPVGPSACICSVDLFITGRVKRKASHLRLEPKKCGLTMLGV